jgi:hypothetical protein
LNHRTSERFCHGAREVPILESQLPMEGNPCVVLTSLSVDESVWIGGVT